MNGWKLTHNLNPWDEDTNVVVPLPSVPRLERLHCQWSRPTCSVPMRGVARGFKPDTSDSKCCLFWGVPMHALIHVFCCAVCRRCWSVGISCAVTHLETTPTTTESLLTGWTTSSSSQIRITQAPCTERLSRLASTICRCLCKTSTCALHEVWKWYVFTCPGCSW